MSCRNGRHIDIYIYIYKMYMWQMSSVFSHESARRNDAGHLIDKNVFKTTRSFCYQWFHVSTLQAKANRPFILSKCIFKMAAASSALHAWQYEWSISICLKSGNMKPLVAKWPCCFKDIFIYIYIYVCVCVYVMKLIDLLHRGGVSI